MEIVLMQVFFLTISSKQKKYKIQNTMAPLYHSKKLKTQNTMAPLYHSKASSTQNQGVPFFSCLGHEVQHYIFPILVSVQHLHENGK